MTLREEIREILIDEDYTEWADVEGIRPEDTGEVLTNILKAIASRLPERKLLKSGRMSYEVLRGQGFNECLQLVKSLLEAEGESHEEK